MAMKPPNISRIPALTALLERSRQRRREGGAAVFLVVMVLTIVTAIGVFSMRSASLVDLATGYSRQSVQATALAEYAARAAATYLQSHPELVEEDVRVQGCATELLAMDPDATCNVFKTSSVSTSLISSAPSTPAGNFTGLLSLPSDPTQIAAEFVTEMTEPSQANIRLSPGYVSGQFRQVTFTSISKVYPTAGALTDACSPAARGSVSLRTVRSHVIVP